MLYKVLTFFCFFALSDEVQIECMHENFSSSMWHMQELFQQNCYLSLIKTLFISCQTYKPLEIRNLSWKCQEEIDSIKLQVYFWGKLRTSSASVDERVLPQQYINLSSNNGKESKIETVFPKIFFKHNFIVPSEIP